MLISDQTLNVINDSFSSNQIKVEQYLNIYRKSQITIDYITDFTNKYQMYTGGRRGMKTTGHAGKIGFCDLFFQPEASDSFIYYAAKTVEHARALIWTKLKKIKEWHSLDDWDFSKDSKSMILTPRATIRLLGLNDLDAVSKAFGMPFKLFIVDEGQEIRDDIYTATIRDGARWGAYDNNGVVVGSGNPSRNKQAFYSKEWMHNKKIKKYWTNLYKNPLKTMEENEAFLQGIREERGLKKGEEDNHFLRMGKGEWVFDDSEQILQPKEDQNYFTSLPADAYKYIIGVDVGYSAYDAIAVLAYTQASEKGSGKIYLIDEFQKKKQDFRQMSLKVHEFCQKYNCRDIVIDTGALTVKALPEIAQRYSNYSWIPAEKSGKMAWIETLKIEINLGNFKMRQGGIFDLEIPKIQYNEKGELDEVLHHSDMLMAITYPFRYITNYIFKSDARYLRSGQQDFIRKKKIRNPFIEKDDNSWSDIISNPSW